MTREEQKQDLRTVEQIIDDMNLFDDDLMSMVFDANIEATEDSGNFRVLWLVGGISV